VTAGVGLAPSRAVDENKNAATAPKVVPRCGIFMAVSFPLPPFDVVR
jgi:hypothetical protein